MFINYFFNPSLPPSYVNNPLILNNNKEETKQDEDEGFFDEELGESNANSTLHNKDDRGNQIENIEVVCTNKLQIYCSLTTPPGPVRNTDPFSGGIVRQENFQILEVLL